MRILADENMPRVRDLSSHLGKMTTVPRHPIPVAQLADADVLMVRLVTKMDGSLLAGKPIKFVGTATVGTNHVNKAWLKQAGIDSSAASGCDTTAAMEYVFFSLLILAERDGFSLYDRMVGVVGVGNIRRRLQTRLGALGTRTPLRDPLHANCGGEDDFRSPGELVQRANILTFRVPLFKDGSCKTLHLAGGKLIRNLRPGAILINTCRSAAIDNTALLTCLNEGQKSSVVLGVWGGGPELSTKLPKRMDIGASYTAGHTLEGKARSIIQVFGTYNKFIEHEQYIALDTLLPALESSCITLHDPLGQPTLKRLVHLVYDMRRNDAPLCKIARIPGEFDRLHKDYLEHREWSSPYVICDDASMASLPYKLGFNAVYRPVH